METRANHVWVGMVTLALLAALAALVVWLTRINHPAQNAYDIYFKQSVEGLAKGSQVTYAGVPAGQVKDIALWRDDPQFVRVRIAVDKKVPVLQGTTATLEGSFTGVSTILLNGAKKGAPPIDQPGPDGAPVIPTQRGGLGALLSNAPQLMERLATLSERLAALLSDQNQLSIQRILAHTDTMTGELSRTAPDVKRTMGELQATLRQANHALASFEQTSASATALLNQDGTNLAGQLRETLKSAQTAAASLQITLDSTSPAARRINDRTLPEAEAAIRELEATTRSLRAVTDRINDRGISGVMGAPKLPDYKP